MSVSSDSVRWMLLVLSVTLSLSACGPDKAPQMVPASPRPRYFFTEPTPEPKAFRTPQPSQVAQVTVELSTRAPIGPVALALRKPAEGYAAPGPLNAPKVAQLPRILASVVPGLKAKSRVPILLPTALPNPYSQASHVVIESASSGEYVVTLWYRLGIGGAGFAGVFDAQRCSGRLCNLPDIGFTRVALVHGIRAYFRPISCGGSCAGANIWWLENEVLYQVQLAPGSDRNVDDQRVMMTQVANSAILAGPR